MALRSLLPAPLLVLCACGDALVDGDYRGEPLITIRGEILQDEPLGPTAGPVLVSVFWGATTDTTGPQVEQALRVRTEFPSRYMLEVFKPPSDEVMFDTPGGDQHISMGLILLYEDANDDALYSPDTDTIIGTSRSSVLIWIDEIYGEAPAAEMPSERSYIVGTVDNESCAGPPGLGDADSVSLVVGTLCEELADLDCDGRNAEWGELCAGQ